MQRPEPSVAAGGGAVRIHVRRRVSAAHGGQGTQSRYGVVFDHRPGVAYTASSLRSLALNRQLRRVRRAAPLAGRHPPGNTDGAQRIEASAMPATKDAIDAALEHGHTIDITT